MMHATSELAREATPTTACSRPSNLARKIVTWTAQLGVAAVLAQTLFFKFTYAPETQVIFAERGGRLAATAVGLVELLCVILLIVPRTAAIGAILSLLVIGGAIFTHLTSLGIEIIDPVTGEGDGGLLFGLALTVALGSMMVLAFRWRQLPWVNRHGVAGG
jgi:putative oxidoreductase